MKSILSTKILFSKISFFFQNFVLLYFILLKFFSKIFCDEQCSFSDSGTVQSPKTELGAPGAHLKPRLHAQACVPAQASICHNTAEPTVCLLSFVYATIQPSLLCAFLTFYMPQYSRAYCVPAQPSICHNTIQVLQYNFFFLASLQYNPLPAIHFQPILQATALSRYTQCIVI